MTFAGSCVDWACNRGCHYMILHVDAFAVWGFQAEQKLRFPCFASSIAGIIKTDTTIMRIASQSSPS